MAYNLLEQLLTYKKRKKKLVGATLGDVFFGLQWWSRAKKVELW
jgi:hypothetical protein